MLGILLSDDIDTPWNFGLLLQLFKLSSLIPHLFWAVPYQMTHQTALEASDDLSKAYTRMKLSIPLAQGSHLSLSWHLSHANSIGVLYSPRFYRLRALHALATTLGKLVTVMISQSNSLNNLSKGPQSSSCHLGVDHSPKSPLELLCLGFIIFSN